MMSKRQVLEFFLFLLVLCLLAWIFVLSADYTAVARLRSEIMAVDKQNALFSQKIAALQNIDAKLAAAANRLNKMKKWATGSSLPQILAFCEQLCQQFGLHLRSFEPGRKTDLDFYTANSITINLTGSFQAQTAFLRSLSRFEKLLTFQHIVLQKSQTEPALNMRLVFQTYRLQTPERGEK